MSKAEKEANKRYNITRGDDTEETSGIDIQRALDYIDGYHQAEKDLELTWEDMKLIWSITDEMDNMPEEEFYKEVLKRFKERKEEV